MLSRTADHVYWLGRYAERAEELARTLDVQYRLSLLPHERSSDSVGWAIVLRTLGLEAAYAGRHERIEPHRVIDFLAFDADNPSSILSCLRAARENARAVRGAISSEMWRPSTRPGSRRAPRRRTDSPRSTSRSSWTG
jgi:uncharacterized alpha-E superfamily protein